MVTAFELAGFFAAHGIWCVSNGETLIPMLAYTKENGERQMDRLALDDIGGGVEYGKERLEANEMDAMDAVLVYDARIPMHDGSKCDALVLDIRAYFSPGSVAVMAVPYSPKSGGWLHLKRANRFRVHRPKLLAWENCEDFDRDAALQVFFEGVTSHEKGAAIWNEALDESK